MVIFFDCTFVNPDLQLFERDQAVKFVGSTSVLNRMMAIMNFSGTLHVDQDFTANADLLKSAIQKVRFSPYSTDPSMPPMPTAKQRFIRALRDLMQSVRVVAKGLGNIPGRKTMMYLSNGISVPPEIMSDFQDTVDALNKPTSECIPLPHAVWRAENGLRRNWDGGSGLWQRAVRENATPPGFVNYCSGPKRM